MKQEKKEDSPATRNGKLSRHFIGKEIACIAGAERTLPYPWQCGRDTDGRRFYFRNDEVSVSRSHPLDKVWRALDRGAKEACHSFLGMETDTAIVSITSAESDLVMLQSLLEGYLYEMRSACEAHGGGRYYVPRQRCEKRQRLIMISAHVAQ